MTVADVGRIARNLKALQPGLKSGTVGEKQLWHKTVSRMEELFAGSVQDFNVADFRAKCGITEEYVETDDG